MTRTLDSASFNAWFTAFTAGNVNAERLAAKRMRPGYRPAFNAWLATDPAHNPNAPPGPAYMPQYVIPQEAAAKVLRRAGRRRVRRGRRRGFDSGQVHPRHRVPGDRAVSRRDQRPLPDSPSAPGPDRRRSVAAGVRGDPVARPTRTAVVAPERVRPATARQSGASGIPGSWVSVNRAPCPASDPEAPPPRPRRMNAMPTATAAPAIGPPRKRGSARSSHGPGRDRRCGPEDDADWADGLDECTRIVDAGGRSTASELAAELGEDAVEVRRVGGREDRSVARLQRLPLIGVGSADDRAA